jgi:hypothetical protein
MRGPRGAVDVPLGNLSGVCSTLVNLLSGVRRTLALRKRALGNLSGVYSTLVRYSVRGTVTHVRAHTYAPIPNSIYLCQVCKRNLD